MRRTKLVCTIGPATYGRIPELVSAGLDVARLNFSHGVAQDHRHAAAAVRRASADAGRTVAILADLPGPKVRLGHLSRGSITLREGSRLLIRGDGGPGDESVVSTNHPSLGTDLQPGDRILLADGAAELVVVRSGNPIETEVVRGGTIRSAAGVNIPSERLSLPAITDRDREALAVALALGVDFIAMSFVRRAADLRELRKLLGRQRIGLVAKLETRAAVEDLESILEATDAVMVARGDLGVEIPFEEIPIVQKRIVSRSVAVGRPVIVATQMLESMTNHSRPTRAEASDAATAVLDGADAVMLSAETAVGRFPIDAAQAAARICAFAEENGASYETVPDPSERALQHIDRDPEGHAAWAIASAAADLADRDPAVAAIACYTTSGRSAELLASARPHRPIFAFSADSVVVRQLALRRGVIPVLADQPADTDAVVSLVASYLTGSAGLPVGASVVVVAASPIGQAQTNVLRVHRLGS